MATTGDFISLILVIGLIYLIYYTFSQASPAAKDTLKSQQDLLKKKGFNISSSGISVKTDARAMSREEYVEKTQRGISKSGDLINRHKEALSWGSKSSSSGSS